MTPGIRYARASLCRGTSRSYMTPTSAPRPTTSLKAPPAAHACRQLCDRRIPRLWLRSPNTCASSSPAAAWVGDKPTSHDTERPAQNPQLPKQRVAPRGGRRNNPL